MNQSTEPAPSNGVPQQGAPPEDRSGYVHPNQFSQAVRKRDEARAEAESLREQLAQAQNQLETFSTIGQTVKQLEADLKASNERYAHHATVTGEGIANPAIVSAITEHYSSIPESKRPKLGDMLADWRAALTAEDGDVSAVPYLLRPHLEAAWAGASADPAPTTRVGHNPHPTTGSPGGPVGDPSRIYDLTRQLMDGKITREEFAKQTAAVRKASTGR